MFRACWFSHMIWICSGACLVGDACLTRGLHALRAAPRWGNGGLAGRPWTSTTPTPATRRTSRSCATLSGKPARSDRGEASTTCVASYGPSACNAHRASAACRTTPAHSEAQCTGRSYGVGACPLWRGVARHRRRAIRRPPHGEGRACALRPRWRAATRYDAGDKLSRVIWCSLRFSHSLSQKQARPCHGARCSV